MRPTLIRSALSAAALVALALAVMAEPKPAAETAPSPAATGTLAIATFASGCYWCTESDFDKVDGVVETISGFMGGHTKNPTYEQVGTGDTGHVEVVQLTYDTAKVSYEKLVEYYWRHTDVVDGGGQFCDRGSSYRPVIFAHTPEQKEFAEASKAALDKSGRFDKPVAVSIETASDFTAGPGYHQNYYQTHAVKYNFYRTGCGRDARLKQLWGSEAASH